MTTSATSGPVHTHPLTRWELTLLVGIVALGVILRFWGLGYGLPYLYVADEAEKVLTIQRIVKTGDLNPHYFLKPSLVIYLNALAYVPYYLAGTSAGLFDSLADIPGPTILTIGVGKTIMRSPFLLGRALTALAGSAAVVAIFFVGRQWAGNAAVGLLAALMMAVSPTHVRSSHFIQVDAFLVLFMALSLWASVRVFQEGRMRYVLAAGIAAGLAASSKYPGALALLALVTAQLLRSGVRGLRDHRWYWGLVAGVVTFLVTTPFAILDYRQFLSALLYEFSHYATGHPGMEGDTPAWYLAYMWQAEGPLALWAAVEILRGVYVRSKEIIVLSVFPLMYFAFISLFAVRNPQTLLLLLPYLILLASSLLWRLLRRSRTLRLRGRSLSWAVGALFLATLAIPFCQTVKDDHRLTIADSRETARAWIERNLPAGAHIAIESYAPYVDPQRFRILGVTRMIDHASQWYISNGFDYLVFGEGMFGRFYQEPERYRAEVAQYEALFRAFEAVRIFTNGGYEVRIYRVGKG